MPAIGFTLEIDGAPVDPELLDKVQQVEVEEHALLADMLRLRLSLAVQPDGSDWSIDESLFPRLGTIRVLATLGAAAVPLIEAHIVETGATFSNEPGQSTFDVVGMDATALMNLEEKVRDWPDMTDSDIADTIFGEYGFDAVSDTTQPARQETDATVLQRGTDIQFLRQLANRNGYECYVELNPSTGAVEGHFHAPRLDENPQGVLTVNMGEVTNVNSFTVRFDMLRPTTARVTGLDIGSREDQPAAVTSLSLTELGSRPSLNGDRPRLVLLSGTGLAETAELTTLAQAVVDRSTWAVTADGELNPIAFGGVLRAKRVVSVRGAGRQFSGEYYVEKVLHVFDGDGFSQRFALRRNALGLSGQEEFVDDGALAS